MVVFYIIIYLITNLIVQAVTFATIFCRIDNLKGNINKLEYQNDKLETALMKTINIFNGS
jgi:hypothetical protein